MRYLLITVLLLTACAPAAVQSPNDPVVEPSVLEQMVDQENAYRAQVGQEPLTSGLTCTLYTVPTTTTAIIGATGLVNVASFTMNGPFYQVESPTTQGLNILPIPLQSTYQNWIIVKCTGNLVATDSGYQTFGLTSDDGANLYIDGLLINNDGLHPTATKSATKLIKYGFHSFELDYLQGTGLESLVLTANDGIMPPNFFVH